MFTAFSAPLVLFLLLHVHHWVVFLVFVCLGIFQTFIAFYGGYLAVLALPAGVEKTQHHRVFRALAVALFVLTIVIGWLNDKAQFQAEQEANASRKEVEASRHEVQASRNEVQASRNEVQASGKEVHETNVNTRNLLDQVTAILGHSAAESNPLGGGNGDIQLPQLPGEHVAPAVIPPSPSQRPSVSASSPQSVLRARLQNMIYILGAIDGQRESSIFNSGKSFFQHQPSTGPWSMVVPVAEQPNFLAKIVSEQNTYRQEFLPQVKQMRADVLAVLRLSPTQLSQDEKTFRLLNEQIFAPPEGPAPTRWDDPRLGRPTPMLAPMQLYLSVLQLRLSAMEGSPSHQ